MRKDDLRFGGGIIFFLAILGTIVLLSFLTKSEGFIGATTALANSADSVFTSSGEPHSEAPPKDGGAPRKPLWNTDWSDAANIFATLLLASVLSALISYRRRGGGAQKDFMEAHIILSVAAALMMMIIGSQIARAFGLMGAASIVRYRDSLKSPKEASSLVIALGVGMACGVGLYPLAIIASLYIAAMINLFEHIPPGIRRALFPTGATWVLKVRTSEPEQSLTSIKEYFVREDVEYKILQVSGGKGQENNLTEIEVEIFGKLDRNAFSERLTADGAIRVGWRLKKSEDSFDMDLE